MSISSQDLKTALMSYYRYKLGHVCSDEVGMQIGNADILVDTGNLLIEVETKISRSDLFQGEKRKSSKHEMMKNVTEEILKKRIIPNQFYIAVPTELVPDAIEWVEKTNPNYGVIECRTRIMELERLNHKEFMAIVKVIRKAKMLHDRKIGSGASHLIGRRLSSARTWDFQLGVLEWKRREKERLSKIVNE